MYLVKPVNKLFYNKFFYALELTSPFYGIFRNKNLKYVQKCIDILNLNYTPSRTDPFKKHEVTGLPIWLQDELQQKLIPYYNFVLAVDIYKFLCDNEECMLRVEYPDNLKIYSNEKRNLITLAKQSKHGNYPVFYEPDVADLELLRKEPNVVLIETPDFGYEYKCKFTNRARANDAIYKWLINNAASRKVRITESTLELCKYEKWLEGRFFYCKNHATLTMAMLVMPDIIGKVEKLLYNDK